MAPNRAPMHARKTILLKLIHPFTTQIVPSLYHNSFPAARADRFHQFFVWAL